MIDVVGIDAPCMDFLVNLDRLPTKNSSQPFREASWQGGGKAATALIAMARLGGSAGIIANLGGDLYGDMIAWDFKRHGVDTSRLRRVEGAYTSLSLVLSERETMGRSVLWQGGGAPLVTLAEEDKSYLREAKYLHVPGISGVFGEAASIVRASGGKVSIDADRYDPAIMEGLDRIDVFIASEFFFDSIAGGRSARDCCRAIREKGPGIVVFTFGEKGCAGLGEDGAFFELPAFPVPVVDTTGAGDVFHGAFLYGLSQGWGARECARWASATSAIKVTRLGGRAGIPTAGAVRSFLDSGALAEQELDARAAWYAASIENTIKKAGGGTVAL